MKYLVKYRWWSLFDRKTPANEREDFYIEEAESVDKLLADHNKTQGHILDGGRDIIEIYELGDLKYKVE